MRSLADRYRDLFPGLIGDSVQDSATGAWRHSFFELSPRLDVYVIQPGARSGTTTQNWATELNNRRAAVGTLVWIRHRDEVGQLHYEFECGCACCCSPCFEGVEVVGPALPWVDDAGLWDALDLTAADGIVIVADGTPAVHQGVAIADVPTGGGATAADNATAINLILARLRAAGLIAT